MSATRIAFITGATSGIGRAITLTLAKRGVRVLASGRDKERLAALYDDFPTTESLVIGLTADVRSSDLVPRAFSTSLKQWAQQPDIVVLCAGRGLPGTILTSDSTQWPELIDTNYVAVLNQLRQTAQLFSDQQAAEQTEQVRDIVVVGSTVGRDISASNPVYGSTKYAVHSLVEALRREVCTRKIRVTLIEPGFVRTNFQSNAGYDSDWFRSIEDNVGPLLRPEDVAGVIDFVVRQPSHVHVDNVRIRPTRQQA